jgi:hypothetical protein
MLGGVRGQRSGASGRSQGSLWLASVRPDCLRVSLAPTWGLTFVRLSQSPFILFFKLSKSDVRVGSSIIAIFRVLSEGIFVPRIPARRDLTKAH